MGKRGTRRASTDPQGECLSDQPQPLTLSDGVTSYLESLKSGRTEAQQQLVKFVRWFGQDRTLSAIAPVDIEDFSTQTGSGVDGNGPQLKPVRDFLSYAKKRGILEQNLASHVKVRRGLRKSTSRAARGGAMASAPARLTQEGYDQLRERLEWLQEEMIRAAAEVRRAAADKDVRENAPLEAAREYLGQLDFRRREAEAVMESAQVIEGGAADDDSVRQGGRVTLEDLSTGASQTWMLVDPREAAPLDGRLSTSSPVGQAVLGRFPGDEVEVAAPRGMVRYRIGRAE